MRYLNSIRGWSSTTKMIVAIMLVAFSLMILPVYAAGKVILKDSGLFSTTGASITSATGMKGWNVNGNMNVSYGLNANGVYSNGGTAHRLRTTNTNTTMMGGDGIVGVANLDAARKIYMTDHYAGGQIFTVKDMTGNCTSTYAIEIYANGNDRIEGATSKRIESAYGVVNLFTDGKGGWYVR